jgi:hypothetical protein
MTHETKLRLFGHEFRAMTDGERRCYAKSDDALICYCYLDVDDTVLIYEPSKEELTFIEPNGHETVWRKVAVAL